MRSPGASALGACLGGAAHGEGGCDFLTEPSSEFSHAVDTDFFAEHPAVIGGAIDVVGVAGALSILDDAPLAQGVLKVMTDEMKPQNSWRVTPGNNPDTHAPFSHKWKLFWARPIAKEIL